MNSDDVGGRSFRNVGTYVRVPGYMASPQNAVICIIHRAENAEYRID
jgi:hypothetical protein